MPYSFEWKDSFCADAHAYARGIGDARRQRPMLGSLDISIIQRFNLG